MRVRKANSALSFISSILLCAALLAGVYFYHENEPYVKTFVQTAPSIIKTGLAGLKELGFNNAKNTGIPKSFESRLKIPEKISDINDSQNLNLINGDYSIGATAEAGGTVVNAWPSVAVSTRDIQLRKDAIYALAEMFAAAREAGIGTFYVSSGYRDYAEQKRIYESAKDKSYVQPPDHSEHQTGFAADIMAIGVSQSDLEFSVEGKWLADNAWKYGFLLRYPKDKQDLTGISYEPWHFRYVGLPHARYCHENGLCLEEYLQFLKEDGGYTAVYDSHKYAVIYETAQSGKIYIPENPNYEISGDNAGGYIVTVRE